MQALPFLTCVYKGRSKMSKQRKAAGRQEKPVTERITESIPGVDAAENVGQQNLLTMILRASEALATPQCTIDPNGPSVSHAMPKGVESASLPSDFGNLLVIVEQIAALM